MISFLEIEKLINKIISRVGIRGFKNYLLSFDELYDYNKSAEVQRLERFVLDYYSLKKEDIKLSSSELIQVRYRRVLYYLLSSTALSNVEIRSNLGVSRQAFYSIKKYIEEMISGKRIDSDLMSDIKAIEVIAKKKVICKRK